MASLYQYEIMDRCHVISELISNSLLGHPTLTNEQENAINDALDSLQSVYQIAGNFALYQTRDLEQAKPQESA